MLPEGLQRLALHLQVRRQVSAGGGDTGMTKIVANHGHITPRLQQCHRATVAQDVRRNALSGKRWALFCHCRHMFAQNVRDAVTGQRLAILIQKDMLMVARR
jgi:hypothetical protein